MSSLRQTLDSLALAYFDNVLAAIRAASLGEVQALADSSLAPPLARSPAPALGRPSAAASSPREGRGWGIRVEDYLDRLVTLVAKEPYGIGGGALRRELGIAKTPFLRVAAVALATNRIQRTGTRAGLYYTGRLLKLP